MLAALLLPNAYQLPVLRSAVARGVAPRNAPTVRAAQPNMAAGFFGLGGGGGGLPSEVTEVVNGFATEKDPAAIRALWTELKRAYGDEATAVQAVLRQPQIINPSYTDPPAVISRSKAVLVEYMGEEESIEVMLKNPSVLQCGERGLREGLRLMDFEEALLFDEFQLKPENLTKVRLKVEQRAAKRISAEQVSLMMAKVGELVE